MAAVAVAASRTAAVLAVLAVLAHGILAVLAHGVLTVTASHHHLYTYYCDFNPDM